MKATYLALFGSALVSTVSAWPVTNKNLVANPGFESLAANGVPRSWGFETGLATTTYGLTTDKALVFAGSNSIVASDSSNDANGVFDLSQVIHRIISPRQNYILSAEIGYLTGPAGAAALANASYHLGQFDGTAFPQLANGPICESACIADGKVHYRMISMTVTPQTRYANILVGAQLAGNYTVFFDNVSYIAS